MDLFFFRLNYPPLYNYSTSKLIMVISSLLFYMYTILLIEIVIPV